LGKTVIAVTHTRPDIDATVACYLGGYTPTIFLKGGDEAGGFANVVTIDRGHGELDHHGKKATDTSSSLMAAKFGLTSKHVQQLLNLVYKSDIEAISLPFDLSDINKCLQRNLKYSDEKVLELGIRLVADTMEFRKNSLQRENLWVQTIIAQFLANKEYKPTEMLKYLQQLSKPGFERPFDLVEVLVAEKTQHGEEEAKKFGETILSLLYEDITMFFEAKKELANAQTAVINGITVMAVKSDNPKINPVCRNAGADIVVQRTTDGHNQIYFDTNRGKVNDSIIDALVSMLRLEECLVQGHPAPTTDLRVLEYAENIPEWYFRKFPATKEKPKPGRLILNGSLTAPDIPPSKIAWETILYIVDSAVRYQPHLDWNRWLKERISANIPKKS